MTSTSSERHQENTNPRHHAPNLGRKPGHRPLQPLRLALYPCLVAFLLPATPTQPPATQHLRPHPRLPHAQRLWLLLLHHLHGLAFGAHAWVLCVVTYSQFWGGLWGWGSEGEGNGKGGLGSKFGNKVSMGLIVGSLLAVLILTFIVLSSGNGNDPRGWAWIDVVSLHSTLHTISVSFTTIPQNLTLLRSTPSPTSNSS